MNRTYCPGWVPPTARCPCPGFPTMQRAPAVSQGGGGASWRRCIRRVDLQDEGTCDTHTSTGAHKGADSELSCGLKARIPLGFFSRRHHLFSAFVNALRVLWVTGDYLWLAVSFWSQRLGLFSYSCHWALQVQFISASAFTRTRQSKHTSREPKTTDCKLRQEPRNDGKV